MIKAFRLRARQVVHQREAQRQRLNAVEPQHHQRVADRADRMRLAVETGVDGLENLGRHRRVVLDRLGNLLDVDVLLLDQIDHFQRDRGKTGQPGRLEHFFEQFLVHELPPRPRRKRGLGTPTLTSIPF